MERKVLVLFTLSILTLISIIGATENPSTLSIAVNDLSAQGVDESEAIIISEQLRAELMKYPKFRLIERSQMATILKEQGFQQTGCTSDACAVEVGQLLGVQNIIVGTVGKAGSYTMLTVRILDVATGEVRANKSIQTKEGIDGIIENGVKSVATDLYATCFPEPTPDNKENAPQKKSIKKVVLIGGGAVAIIGGGAAAYLYLNRKKSPTSEPNDVINNNTRIDLP